MENGPQPSFVMFADDGQYVTCLDWKQTQNGEAFLVCGTSRGWVSIWSPTYNRCLQRMEPKSFIPEMPVDSAQMNTVKCLDSGAKFLCHLSSGDACLFEVLNHLEAPDCWSFQLLKHWKTYRMTHAKYFCLNNQYLVHFNRFNANQIEMVHVDRLSQRFLFNAPIENREAGRNEKIVISAYFWLEKDFYGVIAEKNRLTLYRGCWKVDSASGEDHVQDLTLASRLVLPTEMITEMDFNETTMLGIACSVSKEVYVWKISRRLEPAGESAHIEPNIKRIATSNHNNVCCSIRCDGRMFAIGSDDGRIRVFSLKSGKPLAVLTYHPERIECIKFSCDMVGWSANLLSAACRNGSISIWSLYNNK